MTAHLPEYSPAMLRLMLEARSVLAADDHGQSKKAFAREIARLSGVHIRAVHFAMAGRLRKADQRARLWAVLGHFPSDFGLVLTDDGGQRGSL
jgi:hypothetical protein